MANRRWKRDTSELRPSVTAQHLPSMGFLPLDLSHCCRTAVFQGFVKGHICQQSCGRNIEKEQCALAPLFSSCSPPVLLTNGQTPMLKTSPPQRRNWEATRSFSGLCPTGSETRKPHSHRRRWGAKAQPHSSPQISAQQGGSEHCSGQGDHENCFTTQKCCLGRIVGDFRHAQDSWASGRTGEADLSSLLPNWFMLQSPGPPWQCKSRSPAPVLPVTPTAPGSINLIALERYSSFRLKHKVWYTLKASDLVHVCNLPADQTSPGRCMFFCTWFLGQEIPGSSTGALISVKMDK